MASAEWCGVHEQIIAETQASANTMQEEWDGVHEQIIAERAGGFDDDYSDWAAQWHGVCDAGFGPVQPEYELLPIWDAEQRCFVWAVAVKENSPD
jgi:hypothetical protein